MQIVEDIKKEETKIEKPKSSNIEVVRDYSEVPYIAVDRQQIQQVVLTLLINAEHAISDAGRRGRIEFRTEYEKGSDSIIITVSDNGTGIPPEILPKIFDPFFTTKPVNVGTGLGLSIAHGIIAEQEGYRGQERTGEGHVIHRHSSEDKLIYYANIIHPFRLTCYD